MTALSIRLPDELEAHLQTEAQLAGKSPAEIARLAIAEYLNHREKERFMTELANEMRNGYAKPEIRRAALAMAEELTDDGLNAIIADERVAGLEPREKWWR